MAEQDLYRRCKLCPRSCEVDRTIGERGHCNQTAVLRISSIGPHFGEEPPISGYNGSGTIFFTGCSTTCFFCQNYQISREDMGDNFIEEEFLHAVKRLIGFGVHNLNFVTPDHFWPHIKNLILALRSVKTGIPMLINSSGYEKKETVLDMAGHVDMFMPDIKFSDRDLARYCCDAPDYPKVSLDALEIMVEKKGFLDTWFDDDKGGCPPATKGVLVRHLILPGEVDNSIGVLKSLRERFGKMIPISLLSQYHPTGYCSNKKAFIRRITKEEFEQVFQNALQLEFENLFYQVPGGTSQFLPDFTRNEPFEGNKDRSAPN